MLFVVFNTSYGGLQKIFHPNPQIGFLAHAKFLSEAILNNNLPQTIPSIEIAKRVIFNDYLNVLVLSIYIAVVFLLFLIAILKMIYSSKKSFLASK
jgi:carbon starvation protein